MLVFITVFIIHLVSVNCQFLSDDRRPIIQLRQGTLLGVKVYGDSGRVVDAFFGIPYASPPINNLRFAPPKKHNGWNGTLQASEYSPQCAQIPISNKNNEDCLYLNIWSPENAIRDGPRSVLVFFEGFEFSKSNAISIPGQDLAMEDIIVITVNYRLNIFGFLCLGIPEARGNLGLLDQYFAILWIKENIRYFGGDPDKITLFGHSSGAASIIFHMTSPRTSGLFQRTILSSGSAFSPWHITNDPFAASKKVANLLGCFHREPMVVLKCLQSKSTYDILKSYQDYIEAGNMDFFLPVIDNFLPENDKYLPNNPEKALTQDSKQQVPILIGISKKITDVQYNKWNELANQGLSQLQQYLEQTKIPEIIKRYNFDSSNKGQILELLKWRYMSSSQSDVHLLLKQLKDLDFESKVEAPIYSLLSILEISYIGPLYVYHLDDLGIKLNLTDSSVTSDLLMLFGSSLLNQIGRRRFSSNELRTSNQIKRYVKNFIMFGDPTPMKEGNWRRYTSNDYYIETFKTNQFIVDEEIIFRNRRISFWTQLLPKMAQINNAYTNVNTKESLSPDPTASFRHAMYTLVGLVIALLVLLGICIVLLKKRYKERQRHLHMGY